MMGGHSNNMVPQTANQGQFLQQSQFAGAGGGAMNVNVGLGQPMTQGAVAQVRRQRLRQERLLLLKEEDLFNE